MKKFRRDDEGLISARFERHEAALIRQLAAETAELLTENEEAAGGTVDPALVRLLPDAYPDDEEASAEFRRFTVAGLTERKVSNAQVVIASLASGGPSRVTVRLDPQGVQSWLRTLTDIRLVLAARLGIEHDGDLGFRGNAEHRERAMVYSWTGYVQESLIRALNRGR